MNGRRTHSVHDTRKEAVDAAHDLGRLMNGVPFGHVFCVQPKMGKWAFVSINTDAFHTAARTGAHHEA